MALRVGQFTASLSAPFGGAELYCLALARWLKDAGDESVVVTGAIDDDLREDLEAEGIEVVVVQRWRPYASGRRGGRVSRLLFHALDLVQSHRSRDFEGVVEAARLDVLHVHRWQGFGTGVLRGRNVPRVHTAHDFALVDTRTTLARAEGPLASLPVMQRVRAWASTRSLGDGQAVIFPTERTRRMHLDVGLGLAPTQGRVIGHGWELPLLTAEPHAILPEVPSDRRVVLYLGSLSEAKGVPLLLDAWSTGVDSAELWLAGAGPLAAVVESRAREIPSIRFLGWADPALRAALLRRCSLLALASDWPETFSLVSAEALLAGRPVIATVRSAPEILDPGNSVIVEHSSDALRGGLSTLLGNVPFLDELSESARRSSARFDVHEHLRTVRDVYLQATRR